MVQCSFEFCRKSAEYNGNSPSIPCVILCYIKLRNVDRNNHQLLHEPDRYHVTALHLAAEKGHARSAEEMLSWGANVHCRDDREMTPLHLAAQHDRVE